jgi:pantothenate synthetase
METIDTVNEMLKRCEELRLSGQPIALIPTMEDKDDLEEQTLIALAVRVGKTRLIANTVIGAARKNGM